jgi:hypothetical protein
MIGLTLVERLNLKLMDQWKTMSPLLIRRSSVGVAALNNYLYASMFIPSSKLALKNSKFNKSINLKIN